jgi:hypothetical protein
MREQDYEAGIALLLEEMAQKPDDAHAIFLKLQEMLNTLRAEGLPVPDDLARLEAELSAEFTAPQEEAEAEPGEGDVERDGES